jgi:hypothetical protein
LPQQPQSWDEACIPLRYLVTAGGTEADEQAVTNPAQWAVLLYEDTALCDVESGDQVDEDAVDFDTEDQPDATPAEGLRHANTVTETTVFTPEYFCLDEGCSDLHCNFGGGSIPAGRPARYRERFQRPERTRPMLSIWGPPFRR